MGYYTNWRTEVPASDFMERHRAELAESEDQINATLLRSIFPGGLIPLSWLGTPSPQRDAWLLARETAPGRKLIKQMRNYWLVRLLRAANKEHSPEAYRELLESLLIKLGIEAPEGLLISWRRRRGAPRKQATEQIYRTWMQSGCRDWSELAFAVYGSDYTRADAKQRKTLRDRCRRAVRRYETSCDVEDVD